MEKMDFNDGKYTVINENGNLHALRNGEKWERDLIGDNLVYWMLVDCIELKKQRDELLSALETVAFRATHNEMAHCILICDEAIAKVKK